MSKTIFRARPAVLSFLCLGVLLGTAACSTTAVAPRTAAPELTFTEISPYMVEAALVDVQTTYQPGADPRDISSRFPVPPDIALKRYAENRLKPGGLQGQMDFVIEDARVYLQTIKPESTVANWVGAGEQDQYELFIRVRLRETQPGGLPGRQAVLTFNRTLTMPASASLDDREYRQVVFLDALMKDIDAGVTRALQEKFSMTDTRARPLLALLSRRG